MSNFLQKLPRLGVLVVGFSFVAGVFLFGFAYFTVSIPDPNAYVNSQSTIIQYADGSEIGRIGSENRTVVTLAQIPTQLRNAVMAAEDRGFYNNRAFSPTGIIRAIWNNLRGGSLQGGSTITQQYSKTAFLTPERSSAARVRCLQHLKKSHGVQARTLTQSLRKSSFRLIAANCRRLWGSMCSVRPQRSRRTQ